MAKDKTRVTARYPKTDAALLLTFNIKTKRIVDLCNRSFEDDFLEKTKDYSSWHRALDGKEVWEGIVRELDGLLTSQTEHPRKYLPPDDPSDDLAAWMKKIAGAPWWRDVLQVSASQSAFNAWFSGRAMGKDKVVEVREKVIAWWARVKAAADRAELATLGHDMALKSHRNPNGDPCPDGIESYFYTKVVEEGMSLDDARKHYVDMMHIAGDCHTRLINLANPQDPIEPFTDNRDGYRQAFDDMAEAGFPSAVPSTPPDDFDDTPWVEEKQWPDRRSEEGPWDLNQTLWKRFHKIKKWYVWDKEKRHKGIEMEIISVRGDDGQWREPTEREKRNWDHGTRDFVKFMHDHGKTPVSLYQREIDDAQAKVKHCEKVVRDTWQDEEIEAAERELRAARDWLQNARKDY